MDDERSAHLSLDEKDNLIRLLHKVIRFCVRSLAVLTTLLIAFSVMDVVWVMFRRLSQSPILVLRINDILYIFGTLLVVLIAIEIFINITLYLREDVIHVKLVIATALMAIARKVIVLDYKEISYEYVYATAAVVLSLGITYSLITGKNTKRIRLKSHNPTSPCDSKENQTDARYPGD
ncbi:MAG: phosphate-starvation-inducible PsiE family protein [Desulfatiglans sp.]|jgi:uncharacterized membrane protein (DUF373 family)|nr:phosphate-starvation-inducible PsiE family protein [Thermodesulfobacteriota bacterium]MEE4351794.1 phosphate-starvation-inducible PsiE family protein [Desulfatiglans sp.]